MRAKWRKKRVRRLKRKRRKMRARSWVALELPKRRWTDLTKKQEVNDSSLSISVSRVTAPRWTLNMTTTTLNDLMIVFRWQPLHRVACPDCLLTSLENRSPPFDLSSSTSSLLGSINGFDFLSPDNVYSGWWLCVWWGWGDPLLLILGVFAWELVNFCSI